MIHAGNFEIWCIPNSVGSYLYVVLSRYAGVQNFPCFQNFQNFQTSFMNIAFCYVLVMLMNVAQLMLTSLKLLLLLNHNIHIVASIFLALSRCTDNSF